MWIRRYTYCIPERKRMGSHTKDSCYHFSVILSNSKVAWVQMGELVQIISLHFQNNTLNNCIGSREVSSELLFMMTMSQFGIWKDSKYQDSEQRENHHLRLLQAHFHPPPPFIRPWFKTWRIIREISFWNIFIKHWAIYNSVKGIN